jgi:phosphotriesterase-related protein
VIDLSDRDIPSLVDEMVRDLTEGMPEAPDVRAGVIKVGTSKDAVHPDEEKMLRAAAIVQRDLGVPITTHTTKGTIPEEQIRIFEDAGANLEQVCIGHQDLKLDYEQHLRVVRSGARIGYDCISKEHYGPDKTRVQFIKDLIEAGYGDQILVAGDIARQSYLTSYGGGPGFTYILWRFIPWLWTEGVSREDTDKLLIDNPARFLAWST